MKLARTLTTAISEYLRVESTVLETGLTTEPDDYPGLEWHWHWHSLSLYPKCPQPDRVQLAICPHTDHAGALTVLHQNQVSSGGQ